MLALFTRSGRRGGRAPMSKRAAVRWAVAKWTALALAALLLALMLWKWRDWQASARMGAAYAARLTCSCRYVEGRSAESCAQDIRHETRLVSVTERPEQRRIIARVPLLGRAEAGFRPGYGCLIQP